MGESGPTSPRSWLEVWNGPCLTTVVIQENYVYTSLDLSKNLHFIKHCAILGFYLNDMFLLIIRQDSVTYVLSVSSILALHLTCTWRGGGGCMCIKYLVVSLFLH